MHDRRISCDDIIGPTVLGTMVLLKCPQIHDICQNINLSTLLGTPEKSTFF
jgi:hypothetical protein